MNEKREREQETRSRSLVEALPKENDPVEDSMEVRERLLRARLRDLATEAEQSVEDIMSAVTEQLEAKSRQARETYEKHMQAMREEQAVRKVAHDVRAQEALCVLLQRIFRIGALLAAILYAIYTVGMAVYFHVYQDMLLERQKVLQETVLDVLEGAHIVAGEPREYQQNFYMEVAYPLAVEQRDRETAQHLLQQVKGVLATQGWHITQDTYGQPEGQLLAERDEREIALTQVKTSSGAGQTYVSAVWLSFPPGEYPLQAMQFLFTSPLEQRSGFVWGFALLGIVSAMASWLVALLKLPKRVWQSVFGYASNHLYYGMVGILVLLGSLAQCF